MKKTIILIIILLAISLVFLFGLGIVAMIIGNTSSVEQIGVESEPLAEIIPEPTDIKCYNNTDCGIDEYLGQYHCKNNDVYDWFIGFTCVNPGTNQSYCKNETIEKLIDDCQENEYCLPGESTCQYNETCTPSWKCYNVTYKGYQLADCSWINISFCEFGCENGKCLTNPNYTCTDTDGGFNLIEKGTTTLYRDGSKIKEETDYCTDTYLTEYFCGDSDIESETIACSGWAKYCYEGRCTNETYVPIPTPPERWTQPFSDFISGLLKTMGSLFGFS